MKTPFCTFLLMLTLACSHPSRDQKDHIRFRKPVLVQYTDKDTVKYPEAHDLSESWPYFLGKYKFSDTLVIRKRMSRDTSFRGDYIDPRAVYRSDTLGTDGFELVPDYTSQAGNDYEVSSSYCFPVYIVNQTPLVKAFIGKDSYVFGIQEAVDTNGCWRPIEGRGFDFCGHGYWGLKVHPREYLAVLFPKYQGSYQTKLRVRMKIGDNVYVSRPFAGKISMDQFRVKKDGYFCDQLKQHRASAIQELFYGSTPQGADDDGFSVHVAW